MHCSAAHEQAIHAAYAKLHPLVHELGRTWSLRLAARNLLRAFAATELAMAREPLDVTQLLAIAYAQVEFFELHASPQVTPALEAARAFLACCGVAYGLRPCEIATYPARAMQAVEDARRRRFRGDA